MPPKRKSKKRARTEPAPEDSLDEGVKDEIVASFQNALEKGQQRLTISESKACLRSLGVDVRSGEIREFIDSEDLNQQQFLRLAASKITQDNQAHKAFELIDQDGKGVVVIEDLQRVAQELGEDLSRKELDEMMELADRSGGGLLTPKDFVRLARKINL